MAFSEGRLTEPYKVIRYKDIKILSEKLQKIIKENNIEKIIVGLSEGKMAEETKAFARKLNKEISLPIEYFDETLSTYEAQRLAQEAGMKRKKRKEFEDAFAAAVMLQSYLENYV